MSNIKPWFRPMVTHFLETAILTRPDMTAFEWGMGSSTTWLAERIRFVTSVEHDPDWFNAIPKQKNSDRILILPEKGIINADPADPAGYFSDDERWPGHNFKRYASAIDSLGLFDLIVIDGRARPSCVMHGKSHLKVGGFLVLDDTHREYYLRHTKHFFDGWDRFAFWEKKRETTIWRRPR